MRDGKVFFPVVKANRFPYIVQAGLNGFLKNTAAKTSGQYKGDASFASSMQKGRTVEP